MNTNGFSINCSNLMPKKYSIKSSNHNPRDYITDSVIISDDDFVLLYEVTREATGLNTTGEEQYQKLIMVEKSPYHPVIP